MLEPYAIGSDRTGTTRAGCFWTRIAIIVGVILLLPHQPLFGQGAVIGQIQQIKPVGGASSCMTATPPLVRNAIRLRRGVSIQALSAIPPPEPLRLGDWIAVTRSVDARLSIDDATFGIGDIVLAPQLLCGVVGADRASLISADSGLYDVQQKADTLVFTVHTGGAYLQWADPRHRCRLQIRAADVTAEVCGTQVVVRVDASGQNALFYVREGIVRFIGRAGVQAQAGQLFQLNARTGPTRVPAGQTAESVKSQDINYHSAEIWSDIVKPGLLTRAFRNPWTYAVIGAAGVGTLIVQQNPGSRRGTSTVVIRIPLQ